MQEIYVLGELPTEQQTYFMAERMAMSAQIDSAYSAINPLGYAMSQWIPNVDKIIVSKDANGLKYHTYFDSIIRSFSRIEQNYLDILDGRIINKYPKLGYYEIDVSFNFDSAFDDDQFNFTVVSFQIEHCADSGKLLSRFQSKFSIYLDSDLASFSQYMKRYLDDKKLQGIDIRLTQCIDMCNWCNCKLTLKEIFLVRRFCKIVCKNCLEASIAQQKVRKQRYEAFSKLKRLSDALTSGKRVIANCASCYAKVTVTRGIISSDKKIFCERSLPRNLLQYESD